jgi:hypothetical protein
MSNELDLLTEQEAAELLLMSPKTLQKRRFDKKPPKYLSLNGTGRYRLSDLKEYLENSVIDPQQKGAKNDD